MSRPKWRTNYRTRSPTRFDLDCACGIGRFFMTSQVRKSLVGKTTGRFTSMASTVKQALKDWNLLGNCGACMVLVVLLFVTCLLFLYSSAGVHGDTLDAKEVDWCGPVPSMPSLFVWADRNLLGSLGLAQLRAALAAKNAGRVALAWFFCETKSLAVQNMAFWFWCQVYTIVFLGVNGVGKSTNLAKAGNVERNLKCGMCRNPTCLVLSFYGVVLEGFWIFGFSNTGYHGFQFLMFHRFFCHRIDASMLLPLRKHQVAYYLKHKGGLDVPSSETDPMAMFKCRFGHDVLGGAH